MSEQGKKYKRWTVPEEFTLVYMHERGATWQQITRALLRSESSVRDKWNRIVEAGLSTTHLYFTHLNNQFGLSKGVQTELIKLIIQGVEPAAFALVVDLSRRDLKAYAHIVRLLYRDKCQNQLVVDNRDYLLAAVADMADHFDTTATAVLASLAALFVDDIEAKRLRAAI